MSYKDRITLVPDAPWTACTLVNGWANYHVAYTPAQYCRVNGIVHLQMFVKSGTLNTYVTTLPAGFRPGQRLLSSGQAAGAYSRMDVLTNGQVYFYPGSASWSSFVIAYPADA